MITGKYRVDNEPPNVANHIQERAPPTVNDDIELLGKSGVDSAPYSVAFVPFTYVIVLKFLYILSPGM